VSRDPAAPRFPSRAAAGEALGDLLAKELADHSWLVLGLPRGGVVVAAAVASRLHADLDAYVVRKLGLPAQPELAMGAIASGGTVVWNDEVIARANVPDSVLRQVILDESRELVRRERAYRGDREPVRPTGRDVIVVDDGIATGATARVALRALRAAAPARLVLATPVAPRQSLAELERLADEVFCLARPEPFEAVGRYYADFAATPDEQVSGLLEEADRARERAGRATETSPDRRALS
jgi:putative phosphoribosyl transferase